MSVPKRSHVIVERLERRLLLSGGVGVFNQHHDIGAPALPGSASYSPASGVYSITAAGSDIGGNSDQFHFAYNPADDGSIVARVVSLANSHASAKAGLMFRNGTSANAAFAGVFVTPSSGLTFVSRATDGSTAGQTISFGFQAPRYLRLTRTGGEVAAFHSANGVTWTQLGSAQTISLGAGALVGLAVTSRNVSTTTTATFTSVSILPPGWSAQDIGSPTPPGFAAYDPAGNRFTLSGGGSGVGGSADQFHFANLSMTGGGSVIGLLDSLTAAHPDGEAAIMIRDGLAGGAKFASVGLTASGVLFFKWRSTSGAGALSSTVPNLSTPVWLKLTQEGSTFKAAYSSTGVNFVQIGAAQSIAMTSATAQAGLVVSSHDNSVLASATFASVSALQSGFSSIDVGSPAQRGSGTYDAPSNTYSVVGGGTQIGGQSDEFQFIRHNYSGDGTVVSYVNSISSTDPSAEAGVMFRLDDSAASAFVGLFVTPQNGAIFKWRSSAGAQAQQQVNASVSAPVALRLTRSGNTFTPYYSTDGLNFFLFGPSRTVAMPAGILAGAAVSSFNPAALCKARFTGLAVAKSPPPGAGVYSAADELFLHDLSQRSVRFFYDETNPNTGLVPDGALANGGTNGSPSSIASIGFGLTALTIGDMRGWLTHEQSYERALTTVNFLYNSGAAVNGFFYHFLDPITGQRAWNSELSSIDTALLMAGVLNVAQYWAGTPLENAANNLFNRVNWPWMQHSSGQFYGEWRPETGFGVFRYSDFSEAVLLYLLGLGSPTHPTAQSSWLSWTRTPVIHYAGYTFVTASTRALFTVQYPQAWFDLRGLIDSTGLNYYPNSQSATLAQRQMFIDLSGAWPHYGPNNWGATAADGPNGYTIYGGPPPANIDGTVVPTAPGGSLAFTPRRSIDALRHMQQTYGATVYRKYGFVDAFNPHSGWTSSIVLGIDVGMMLIAAENSRSNFVWNVFGKTSVSRQALASAFPSLTPALLSAVSRKAATGSAAPDLPVSLTDGFSVENRQGGPTQLVLTFGANVVKGPAFSINLSSGSVVSSMTSGTNLIINLSGVADGQTLQVNINDVRHFSTSASGNYSFSLGVLLGDANQDRTVNLSDFNILAANFGSHVPSSAEADFNFDGVVNLNDFNLLAGQFGKLLATVPASTRSLWGSEQGTIFGTESIAPTRAEDEPVESLLGRDPELLLV